MLTHTPSALTQPVQADHVHGTDCQLCDVMRHEITKASQSVPIELATYNIRDDSLPRVHTWRRRYQYDIPVLHLGDKGGSCDSLRRWKSHRMENRRADTVEVWTEIFRHRVTAPTAD